MHRFIMFVMFMMFVVLVMFIARCMPENMTETRICEFSCALFGGFQYELEFKNVESLDVIVALATSKLRAVLVENKLGALVEKCDATRWHIHSHKIEHLKTMCPGEKIWICASCT